MRLACGLVVDFSFFSVRAGRGKKVTEPVRFNARHQIYR
jgi:hypothetical protein